MSNEVILQDIIPYIKEDTKFWYVRSMKGYFYDEFVKDEFIGLGWNIINSTNIHNGEEKLRLRMNTDIESLENENGKIKVTFTDGFDVYYDRIIYAIGGTTPVDFLKNCGIQIDEELKPIFDEHQETTAKNVYVAGDIAFASGGSIAIALNHGYHIVNNILRKRGKIFSHTEKFSK